MPAANTTKLNLNRFFKALKRIGNTERYKTLRRRQMWHDGEQYTHLQFDFDGYPVDDWESLFSAGDLLREPGKIRLREKRPSVVTGYPAQIVSAFTQLLFGRGLKPQVKTDDDTTTEYLNELLESVGFWQAMEDARTIGGKTGSVAIVPESRDGNLRIDVLDTTNLFVVEWADYQRQIPKVVIEQYRVSCEEVTASGEFKESVKWVRNVWTDTTSEQWESEPVKDELRDDPKWMQIGETITHGLGRCPVIWISNTSRRKGEIDGLADYPDFLLDTFKEIDYIFSQMSRAFKANLDPTPVFKGLDVEAMKEIRKGSDNGIALTPQGDASFLEAGFTGFQDVLATITRMNNNVKGVTKCLTFDPESAISEAPSGIALKQMLGPMFSRAEGFRSRYGRKGIEAIEMILTMAGKYEINQAKGMKVGNGRQVEFVWPHFVTPTPTEAREIITTATMAKAGGVASERTTVAYAGQALGTENIDEELKEIEKEKAERQKMMEPVDDPGDNPNPEDDDEE